MGSQITGVSIVCSTVCSGADQRKHQSSASLALYDVNSPLTGEFPAQRASNAENFFIWYCRHGSFHFFPLLIPKGIFLVSTTIHPSVQRPWPHHSIKATVTTVCSGADQTEQSSASLAFVRGIHRWSVNSPHKGPVTRKMFSFDDVIMGICGLLLDFHNFTPSVGSSTLTL